MDANIAIAQAMGLRRVAADLDRGWDDFLHGTRTPDKEEFAGEEFAGCMLAAPILRALAAELALKAIASKMTGTHERGHDLLKLFDGLDQSARDCIERQDAAVRHVRTHGSVRSVLANHKDDFTGWRYLARPPGHQACTSSLTAPDCPSSAKVSGPRRNMGAESDAAGGSSISAWTGPV